MEKNKIKETKIISDRELERELLEFQVYISEFNRILQDYLYLDMNNLNHPISKNRTKKQFFSDCNRQFSLLEECISALLNRQKNIKYIQMHI